MFHEICQDFLNQEATSSSLDFIIYFIINQFLVISPEFRPEHLERTAASTPDASKEFAFASTEKSLDPCRSSNPFQIKPPMMKFGQWSYHWRNLPFPVGSKKNLPLAPRRDDKSTWAEKQRSFMDESELCGGACLQVPSVSPEGQKYRKTIWKNGLFRERLSFL